MSLNDKFHEFYREVVTLEKQLADGGSAAEARERLVALVARQQHESERDEGHYGAELYARAKYAMAALADEIFLKPETNARDPWMNHLLEAALFRSQRAGEKFFEDVDDLANDRGVAAIDLARIYLTVLGLGFQGKYRDSPDAGADLAEARRKLYRVIYKREPRPLSIDDRLAPDAYTETAADAIRSELAYRRPWVWALVIVVILWLGASHALWRSAINDLEPLLEDVFDASRAAAPVVAGGAS
ncbi:MAG TPA: DotU family type IV/VI secretion system protein [Thermoanaerobaculia bacterium]|nr:DotU family type IV/VI secretion system protein [Thermoanaerobaculia bacterium]